MPTDVLESTPTNTVSAASQDAIEFLRQRRLRPAAELAQARPHGDRLKYVGGCRCTPCRAANTQYEKQRAAARRAGDWNGIVPADRARAHMLELSRLGVGRHTVHDVTGVANTVLLDVLSGARRQLRARTERLILGVTKAAAADGTLTSAAPTWRRLNELIRDGYSRAELARRLGMQRPALQIGRVRVTIKTGYKVERLYEQLRYCSAARALALLGELRAEGFRGSHIEQRLRQEAATRGLPQPSLLVRNGRIHAKSAELLRHVHAKLTA